jgi:hypothetical protein
MPLTKNKKIDLVEWSTYPQLVLRQTSAIVLDNDKAG